ncbi:hypothetical protein [Glycomyces harbinensis]|uniref:Uncharacterized protein n=1 Tax=Glycomyces harbinensis TaxID=58114 RepID=A0A1G6V9N9_9ACTN|nr:hypothetical protein [Glycomyces harbinensis]SDD50113.1 hypothetical protein SAMN05216270_104288 [Glycomyces harbinensis]
METITAPDKMSRSMRHNGVMICAFFGFGWFMGGAGILGDGPGRWIGIAGSAAVSIALVVAAFKVESARERPRELPKHWGRSYGIWILFEVVLIAAAVFLFNTLDLVDFLPGTIAVIVGAHFLPLAPAFDEPKYRWTGYAMIAAGLGGVAGGFGGIEIGGAVAGFGSALVLWATGVAVVKRG